MVSRVKVVMGRRQVVRAAQEPPQVLAVLAVPVPVPVGMGVLEVLVPAVQVQVPGVS